MLMCDKAITYVFCRDLQPSPAKAPTTNKRTAKKFIKRPGEGG